MKKMILLLSILMIIGLITAMYFYEKQSNIKPLTPLEMLEAQPNGNEQLQTVPLQPIHVDDSIGYSLQNAELNITYNNGENWLTVPIEKNLLFEGEYNGNEQELIEQSYILNENLAAFLYTEGPDWDQKQILLTYSRDQGKTWENAIIAENFAALRFRKVQFLNKNFGYVIVSAWRTMSSEFSTVFVTHDGGRTWEETTNSGVSRLISDGGFVDETTGFLSFGIINPEKPDFYFTQDGGNTWSESTFHIPAEYNRIFVTAEVPFKEEDHLAVFVNQGPNGDYKGGRAKGKFVSTNSGKTWEFRQEVVPNEEG